MADKSCQGRTEISGGGGGGGSSGNNRVSAPTTDEDSNRRQFPASARRKKLTRPPRLESVSESDVSVGANDSPHGSEFGVRSYLHNFYENPKGYQSCSGYRRFGRESLRRKRCRCGIWWWKACAWVGFNLLILSVIISLIGYLVNPRKEIQDVQNNIDIVDEDAIQFNERLNTAKLVGLVLLCVGGVLLAVSLLIPSFSSRIDDDGFGELSFFADSSFPPYMPVATEQESLDEGIPYTSELTSVQPMRDKQEGVIAGKDVQVLTS
ncbi:neurensin-1-like [Anneissia japonica]|uniref:neurensin-1-like n=1 Tax=Anneissia japonica TaxID=1529436 RepID=UPI0014259C17|nr:neurensin-1-like [Anneissia japonica]XP_033097988.1 neurensin-1-like [Anneissia japonica]